MKRYFQNMFLLIGVFVILFSSCNNISSPKETTHKNDTICKHFNMVVYGNLDKDSIAYIVGCDNEHTFSDTSHIKSGEQIVYPEIILKDINGDSIHDMIVPINWTKSYTVIKYLCYLSNDKRVLSIPKIKYRGDYTDFFTSEYFINYNMRILNEDTLMFIHPYSHYCFYNLKPKDNIIVPLITLYRDTVFHSYCLWDSTINDWGSLIKITDDKNYWLQIISKNESKPYIGED